MFSQFFMKLPASVYLVVINVFVYVAMVLSGMDVVSPNPVRLMGWGGNLAPLTLGNQGWRLLSSQFLHAGIVHLLMNMYMLLLLGLTLEERFGKIRFIGVYLVSGLVASLSSALWYTHKIESFYAYSDMFSTAPQLIVSVGASGALMGIVGAGLSYHLASPVKSELHWQSLLQVVILTLGYGFIDKGIDNGAHIGGLVGGFILGLALVWPPLPKLFHRKLLDAVVLGGSVLGVFYFTQRPLSENLLSFQFQALQELAKLEQDETSKEAAQKRKDFFKEDVEKINYVSSLVIPAESRVALGGLPTSVVAGLEDKRVYVTSRESNTLSIVDVETKKIVKVVTGPELPEDTTSGCRDNLCRGRGASGVAVTSNEKLALVASMVPNSVTFVKLPEGDIEVSIPVGRFPRELIIDSEGKRAFVFNIGDGTVSVIDIENRKVVGEPWLIQGDAQFSMFGRGLNMHLDEKINRLYVLNSEIGTVEMFDTVTGKRLEPIFMNNPERYKTMTYSASTNTLWLLNSQKLTAIDKDGKVNSDLQVCEQESYQTDISADGRILFTGNYNRQRVELISLKGERSLGYYPLEGLTPQGLVYLNKLNTLVAITQESTDVLFIPLRNMMKHSTEADYDLFICHPISDDI